MNNINIILAVIIFTASLYSLLVLLPNALEEHTKGKLIVKSLGLYNHCGKDYNLNYYFIDRLGNLYSANPLTWETAPKRGNLLKCSDMSMTVNGEHIVNSLRTVLGTKVTIRRSSIDFNKLQTPVVILDVDVKKDGRHFNVKNSHSVNLEGAAC